jgi:hypothetical protein
MAGMRRAPTRLQLGGRVLPGQIVGAVAALLVISVLLASGAGGHLRWLLLLAAAAVYLYFGVVLPRKPIVAAQREARALRRLTPSFIAFLRVALGSFEAPRAILERYVARPNERWAPMQTLVQDALQVMQQERLHPFAALLRVTREQQCQELRDVAEALAQAEAESGQYEGVLKVQQATLQAILRDEFKRMIRKRTMYLLLMVAVSLVVGILINLLFVMTGGGSVLMNLGR